MENILSKDSVSEQKAVKAPSEKTNEAPTKNEQDAIAVPMTDITETRLRELKSEHKRIFVTDYAGQRFVWHRLNRKTFADICESTENIEDEEEMISSREKLTCERCIVYPETAKVSELIEGDDIVAQKLSREIFYRSGFFPPQTTEV